MYSTSVISFKLLRLKENVVVNNDNDTVTFDYENSSSKDEVIALLSKLGYPVAGNKNSLGKKAKSYVSCAVGRMNS